MGSVVRRTRWLGAGTHRPGRGRLVTIALSVVLLAAGCTDTTRPDADDVPSPDLLPAPATSTGPVRPDPNYERPHSAAGQALLTRFPQPVELGPGWRYPHTGRGSVEVPNAVERDVNDIVDGSVPRDCPRMNPLPLPRAAGEVHYTFHGIPVSAFAVGFDDAAVSRAFLSLLVDNLRDCDLIGRVSNVGEGIWLSARFPDDAEERRADLAVLTGSSVVLMEAPVPLGTEPFTRRGATRIAEALRRETPEAMTDPMR